MTRVLLIDDSEVVLEANALMLEDHGLEVKAVIGGEKGILEAKTWQPDIVLCDLNMPDVSGIDVARRLHEETPEIPVLILTDQGVIDRVVEAMRAGAFGYLIKGSADELILREIEAALAHRKLLAQNRELQSANDAYRLGLERMVDEKTAEVQRLQRISAEAEKLASLGTLIGGVAHEINNPLAVINANLNWLRENVVQSMGHLKLLLESVHATSTPEQRQKILQDLDEMPEVIDEATGCGDRIKRIVATLKRIARRGRVEATCSVAKAIEQVKVVCRPELAPECKFDIELPEGLPEIGIGLDDLVTVVSNLVVNAAHAVDPTRGSIQLEISKGEGGVVFQIADNGSGIREEIRGRIFDPFFTTKAPGKGTGLGLSLVREIVRAAGGDISVESEVGVGTRFQLTLPTAQSAPIAASPS